MCYAPAIVNLEHIAHSVEQLQARYNAVERPWFVVPTRCDFDILFIHARKNTAWPVLCRPQPEAQEGCYALKAKLAFQFYDFGMVEKTD